MTCVFATFSEMDRPKPVLREQKPTGNLGTREIVIKWNGQERKFTGNLHTGEIRYDQVDYNLSSTLFFSERKFVEKNEWIWGMVTSGNWEQWKNTSQVVVHLKNWNGQFLCCHSWTCTSKSREWRHSTMQDTKTGYSLQQVPRQWWKLCRKVVYGMYIKWQYKWFGYKFLFFSNSPLELSG